MQSLLKFFKRFYLLFFIIILSFLILVTSIISKPELTGDGQEYYLMLESLYNHQSPELRQEDIDSFNNLYEKYGFKFYEFKKENAYSGYFQANNNNFYSYHFFGYSLINIPVKSFLELIKFNPLKVFQITNALLLSLMILIIYKLKFSKRKKAILIAIAVFNPIIWFVLWSHTELFCYVLAILAIILSLNKKYFWGILCASIASVQNFPLIIISVIISIYILYNSFVKSRLFKFDFRVLLNLMPIAIAAWPFVFYWLNFGTFNLIAKIGGADFKFITFQKFYELIFDLNIGALPYMPVILIISIVLFLYLFIKFRKLRTILLTSLFMLFFMFFFASTTNNWNHGTTGPSRYVLWSVIPFVFFIFYLFIREFELSRKFIISISFGLVINIIILISVFLPGVSFGNANHSYLATFILNNFPEIYSPSPEIFAERTLGYEDIDIQNSIIIYGNCKKVLYYGKYVENYSNCE